MEFDYSSASDVGNVRTNNEDCMLTGIFEPGAYIFIIADGMGGHNAGEVASYMAVTGFAKRLQKGIGTNIIDELERIVMEINASIIREGKKSNHSKGMGTTLSALYIKDGTGYIAHVGDSRIYKFAKGSLLQLTEDHSLVGKLLKDGFISKAEAQKHPKRNVLYQSVGLKENITVQKLGPFNIKKGDKFLLCSDGLNNDVMDNEIIESLKIDSTEKITESLIKKAKSGAATDNITVIAASTVRDEDPKLADTLRITTSRIPQPIIKRSTHRGIPRISKE